MFGAWVYTIAGGYNLPFSYILTLATDPKKTHANNSDGIKNNKSTNI